MLDRKSIHNMMQKQLTSLPDIPGKQDFVHDAQQLILLDNDNNLIGVTARIWLDKLTDLSDTQLIGYVKTYRAGLLDPQKEQLCPTERMD